MLVLSCDDVPTNPLPATGRQAGVDLGILSFATTSDGEHIDNPRWGGDLLTGWRRRTSGWPGPNADRKIAAASVRRSRPGIARSPTSVRTFTTTSPRSRGAL
jgi:hypothetical protein